MNTYRVYGQYASGPMVAVIVNAWNRADAISRAKKENPGFSPNGRVEEL